VIGTAQGEGSQQRHEKDESTEIKRKKKKNFDGLEIETSLNEREQNKRSRSTYHFPLDLLSI
jgi:hypothetical protein